MQVNDSRPFKANKSASRAEVSLIIVIIISFSWSAYALYKIAIGDADTSVFGFSIAKPAAVGEQKSKQANILNGNSSTVAPELSPGEQLAVYKSEILMELIARQRELLNAVGSQVQQQQQQTGLESLLGPQDLLKRVQNAKQAQGVDTLRGGIRLPSNMDMFARQQINGRRNVQPSSFASANLSHQPLLLNGGPSLSQLSSSANRAAQMEAETRLRGGQQQADERQPDESTVSEDRDYTDNQQAADLRVNSDEESTQATRIITTTTTTTTTTPEPQQQAPETTTTSTDVDGETEAKSGGDEDGSTDSDSATNDADEAKESTSGDDEQAAAEKVDDDSMERALKAVSAIDEEVDRMTQPSVGSVSQHKEGGGGGSRQLRAEQTAVQFDDQPQAPMLRSRGSAPVKSSTGQRNDDHDDPLQVADLNTKKPVHLGRFELGFALANTSSAVPLRSTINGRSKRQALADGFVAGRHTNNTVEQDSSGLLRRLDDENGDEDSGDEEDEKENQLGKHADHQTSPSDRNDLSLQELLAHKQLLDSLRMSRPVATPLSGASLNLGGSSGATQVQAAGAAQGLVKHQPAANNVYTIDDGLLLTPTRNDDHEQKSLSKKNMKKKEKKAKKKLTMAVKKGGHKKKKHKKEEKKYLKEKKFKGAKKGKKMAKGKGGKGGKKGSKFYKDKGFKKKGFKNIYVKNEFGQKKSYFDEFRDKNFKKKWKNFDDKYNYAQMKKWQAKDVKGAKKMKDQGEKYKKYDKGKWKKKYHKEQQSESSKKKKKYDQF